MEWWSSSFPFVSIRQMGDIAPFLQQIVRRRSVSYDRNLFFSFLYCLAVAVRVALIETSTDVFCRLDLFFWVLFETLNRGIGCRR